MNPSHTRAALTLLGVGSFACFGAGCAGLADNNVAVSSSAAPKYTQAKFENAQPRRETYVFMRGRYFEGRTVDRSLDRLTFRELVEPIAQALAQEQYFPAKDVRSADLLVIMHWGVTKPHITIDETRVQPPPQLDPSTGAPTHTVSDIANNETVLVTGSDPTIAERYTNVTTEADMRVGFEEDDRRTESFAAEFDDANNIKLLGYGPHLRALAARPFQSTTEATLRSDLTSERYFVILRAYDLHDLKERKPHAVWTLHLNFRSPGHNFTEAVSFMSDVAVNYFGRPSDGVATVPPKLRKGKVELGEIKIIGETN